METIYYRPYPLSLSPLPLGGEAFGSWVDLWLSLSRRRGGVEIVFPDDMMIRIPRGHWHVPSFIHVFIRRASDFTSWNIG